LLVLYSYLVVLVSPVRSRCRRSGSFLYLAPTNCKIKNTEITIKERGEGSEPPRDLMSMREKLEHSQIPAFDPNNIFTLFAEKFK